MILRTAFASSTLAIAFLFAACAGPDEEDGETSSREQGAAAGVVPPAPPPPNPVRDTKCVIEAREAYAQCVRANPGQQQACADRYEAAYRACPATPPAPPPPPPPVPRDTSCVIAAREAYAQCVRANPADQAACGARYKAAYEACPPATTPPTPPPPPPVPPGRR